MYFTLKTFISLTSLLTLVQSCGTSGGFCGAAAGGAPCCAGLTCDSFNRSNVSFSGLSELWNLRSNVSFSGGFCGAAAGGVPCCAGLFCDSFNRSNFSSSGLWLSQGQLPLYKIVERAAAVHAVRAADGMCQNKSGIKLSMPSTFWLTPVDTFASKEAEYCNQSYSELPGLPLSKFSICVRHRLTQMYEETKRDQMALVTAPNISSQ
ncbi:hypothetical protein C8J57DRAFT_1221597 [Mycena rebaudengoi]|nr:hypothetical protein C8J57DRAFT_1221597 [Mycena rebaudengoi]